MSKIPIYLAVLLFLNVANAYGLEKLKLNKEYSFENKSGRTLTKHENEFVLEARGVKDVRSSSESFLSESNWILTFGVTGDKDEILGDIGVISGVAVPELGLNGGFKVGSEFSFGENFFIGPKIGFEMNFAVISTKLNIINYTDFKKYDPRITPEIGLSIWGYVNLTYGYNIKLLKNNIDNVPTNRLSLSFNIPLTTSPAP